MPSTSLDAHPPAADGDAGAIAPQPLRLGGVVCRRFGTGPAFRPELVAFLSDVARLYEVDDTAGSLRHRNTFTEMVRAVLPELGSSGEPFDLAVMAHGTPDSEPAFPGVELVDGLPGRPVACGIADQGALAPFTALRLVDAHARSGAARRAVVVILDQTTVVGEPVITGSPATAAAADTLVALVLDRAGAWGVPRVRQWPAIAEQDVTATLAGALAETPAETVAGRRSAHDGEPATVLAGPGLAPCLEPAPAMDVVPVRPELPCTGIWAVFAAQIPRWRAAGRSVALADYDPSTGELGICRVDIPAGRRAG